MIDDSNNSSNNNNNTEVPLIYHIPTIFNTLRLISLPFVTYTGLNNQYLFFTFFCINYFFSFLTWVSCKTDNVYPRMINIYNIINNLLLSSLLSFLLIKTRPEYFYPLLLLISLDFANQWYQCLSHHHNNDGTIKDQSTVNTKSVEAYPLVKLFERSSMFNGFVNYLGDLFLLALQIKPLYEDNLKLMGCVYFQIGFYLLVGVFCLRVLIYLERLISSVNKVVEYDEAKNKTE